MTNKVHDIAGTTANSLLKCPKTKWVLNPLNPDYIAPGDIEYKGTKKHMMDKIGESCKEREEWIPKQKRSSSEIKPERTCKS